MREITEREIDALALHLAAESGDWSAEGYLDRRSRIEKALAAPNFFDRTAFRLLFHVLLWIDRRVGSSRKRIFPT